MALTTRAKVLTRLGLTDDAASEAAVAVALDPTGGFDVSIVVSGTTLTVTPTVGSPSTIGLSSITMSGLATSLSAVTGLHAELVTTGTLAASLIDAQTLNITVGGGDLIGRLTFTNSASGRSSTLIDQLITIADYTIGRYCNRINATTGAQTFESGSRDERYDGDEQSCLILRSHPVTAISSVSLYDTAGNESTVASTNYRVEARTGRLHYWGSGSTLVGAGYDRDGYTNGYGPAYSMGRIGWPTGFQNIRVQYTGGYATVPYDLENVATEMVCEMYLNRRQNKRVSSDSMGGRSFGYVSPEDVLKAHHKTLAPYRSLGHG